MTESSVIIRPLEPQHREQLKAMVGRASSEALYRRFHGPKPTLSERELDFLTQVDQHQHLAVAGFEPEGRLVGVARAVRPVPGADCAELAIMVEDRVQGRGLGVQLVQALLERCRQAGLQEVQALIQPDNRPAVRTLVKARPDARLSRSADGIEVLVELK